MFYINEIIFRFNKNRMSRYFVYISVPVIIDDEDDLIFLFNL